MLTLYQHDILAKIENRYANIIYSFQFENLNPSGSNELRFEITIDSTAVISGFEANIDNEIFVGITKEKQTASQEYSEAKTNHDNCILISQPYPDIQNVFEIKTNVNAKSKILLTLKIEQYLQKKFHFNELNIQILRNFSKYNIKPNFEFISFQLHIAEQSGIYDVNIPCSLVEDSIPSSLVEDSSKKPTQIAAFPSAEIRITKNIGDKHNKNYEINGKIPNDSEINELTLKYKIKGEENESYALFDHKSNTFCHIISHIITNSMMSNSVTDKKQIVSAEGVNDMKQNILIPRRVIFVIDRSASMSRKWNKTVRSTIMALKQLRKLYDRYCIILFDQNVMLLPKQGIILANDENINNVITRLKNESVGGSTNINGTLLKAIEMIKNDTNLLNDEQDLFINQILLITDGEPNAGICDTKQIIMNVKNANNLINKICIFSFGVGSSNNDSSWVNDLNHSFLKLLSLNNNGFYKRIKQISVDIELKQYFNILSTPILSNIIVKYNNTKNIKNLTETSFNALYSGHDLIICGQITDTNQRILNLTISATTGKIIQKNNKLIIKPVNICKNIKIDLCNSVEHKHNNIGRICAYMKLKQYAENKLIHNDLIEIDDNEKKEHDSLPLELALKYKFITPWTSMIVVQNRPNNKLNINETKDNDEQLSSSFDTDEDFGWVSYHLTLKGNEFLCQVDDEYIQDKFNLSGLVNQVPYYEYALDLICDVENEERHELDDEHQEMIENDAETLYGLSHARYILTNRGLHAMLEKYRQAEFGTCPRYDCNSQPVLPIGIYDQKGKDFVKVYCPLCEEIYVPQNKKYENIDGAYFGTTFVHLFFLVFPELKPKKSNDHYIPRVFGYRLHNTWHQRTLQAAKEAKQQKFARKKLSLLSKRRAT